MGKLIAFSIDVTKLDKSKLIAGQKGTYANITLSLNDEDDRFGNNCSLWESQSKEEREAKEDRNFLGNGKVIWDGDSQSSKPSGKSNAKKAVDNDHSGLPF